MCPERRVRNRNHCIVIFSCVNPSEQGNGLEQPSHCMRWRWTSTQSCGIVPHRTGIAPPHPAEHSDALSQPTLLSRCPGIIRPRQQAPLSGAGGQPCERTSSRTPGLSWSWRSSSSPPAEEDPRVLPDPTSPARRRRRCRQGLRLSCRTSSSDLTLVGQAVLVMKLTY